jgi:hypothetical protein
MAKRGSPSQCFVGVFVPVTAAGQFRVFTGIPFSDELVGFITGSSVDYIAGFS